MCTPVTRRTGLSESLHPGETQGAGAAAGRWLSRGELPLLLGSLGERRSWMLPGETSPSRAAALTLLPAKGLILSLRSPARIG